MPTESAPFQLHFLRSGVGDSVLKCGRRKKRTPTVIHAGPSMGIAIIWDGLEHSYSHVDDADGWSLVLPDV